MNIRSQLGVLSLVVILGGCASATALQKTDITI
jgi:hypothetical protein